MTDPLEDMVGEKVVLDTASSLVYVGTLTEVTEAVLVLQDADMHDYAKGHAKMDVYLEGAREEGITVNRKRVAVMRAFVISVSKLSDIMAE